MQKKEVRVLISFLVAALFPFYAFIQMNCLNVFSPYLLHTYNINIKQLGILSASYIYADALLLLPAGILLDRFDTRTLLTGCVILSTLGSLLFASSQQFYTILFARIVAGAGHSFALLGCFRLISRWFPASKQGFFIGLVITIALLGGLVAQSPLAILIEEFGWHVALWLNVLLGIIIAITIWFTLPHETITFVYDKSPFVKLCSNLKISCKNKQNWLCGFYICLLGLPLMLLGALWGSSYLTATRHITTLQASWITTTIFLGTILGSPLAGSISDKLRKRKLPMIIGAIGTLLLMLCVLYLPHLYITSLILLFFIMSLFTGAQIVGYPAIVESNSAENSSTAMGFANVLVVGGIATFQIIFGYLWGNTWLQPYAIITLLLALTISILISFWMQETFL